MSPEVQKLWNEYKSLHDIRQDAFTIAEFGDTPELADTLADLIGRGIKTATCSSVQDYHNEGAAIPETGSYFMVVTSKGDPVCLCQVTEIRIGSFTSADAGFAFEEGEDDRSLEAWRRAHRRFFRLSETAPFDAEDSFMLVFERFRRVWPEAPQTPSVSRAR